MEIKIFLSIIAFELVVCRVTMTDESVRAQSSTAAPRNVAEVQTNTVMGDPVNN